MVTLSDRFPGLNGLGLFEAWVDEANNTGGLDYFPG